MSHQPNGLWLCLIRYMKGSGKAGRWCLFVCEDGQPGWLYEIKSHQESLVYEPPTETSDLFPSSPWSMFVLGSLSDEQHTTVREVAHLTLPSVSTRSTEQEKIEATRLWAVQIIEELVKRNIVWSDKLKEVKSMMSCELPPIKQMNDLKRKM